MRTTMPPVTALDLTMRPYASDEDYWRLRDLLRRTMLLEGLRQRSWHVARLDYWWWFINRDLNRLDPRSCVLLWETSRGELVAAITPDGVGEAYLQVDPGHRTPDLDEAMIAAAEAYLATQGSQQRVFVDPTDAQRVAILERRGFRRVTAEDAAEIQHRRLLSDPVPAVPRIPGYRVRAMGDGLELLERCYASGLAFHDDDITVARGNRDDPSWYRHIQTAPLYRRDLDIVAVADDGSVGAFCTAWFDDVTRTAILEPVATVAAHRRRGLARAVILEALHRLREMGCLVAFVGGYSPAANALYGSIMGPDRDVSAPWERPGANVEATTGIEPVYAVLQTAP
jgi:mycothiol synthase